jgi:hypothetical protein
MVYILVCCCNTDLDCDIWYHYHDIDFLANVVYVSGAAIGKGSSCDVFLVVAKC